MQKTNWHVITGAPCSGKTSVIKALARAGYSVVHEAARAYIDEELKRGRRIDEIKSDEQTFEDRILKRKVQIEISLATASTVFLDRAIPDSIAYYRLAGLNPEVPVKKSRIFRYRNVFLFERLAFVGDPVRSEDDATAQQLEMLLNECYQELGYRVLRVPLLSVPERVDFILENLE